jgi:hypothetical protein
VWASLSQKTGWVFLGDVIVAQQSWGTQLHHEIAERKKPSSSIIPGVGDRLRITINLRLVILDYQKRAEERRLESPADHRITKDDLVGFVETGALVEVLEVSHERQIGPLQGVWARVTPAK